MSEQIRLKKGLDLPVKGAALRKISMTVVPDVVALKPTDFRSLTPRMLVKEGDVVKTGTPLFADKKNPEILFTSPVSGTVDAIVRGEKRKLLEVRIKSDNKGAAVKFDVPTGPSLDRESVVKVLLESGLWPCIKQRPYGIIADPSVTPKAIFISAMATAPLAADLEYVLQSEIDALQAGVKVLGKLTKGGVHISLDAHNYTSGSFHKLEGVICHFFSGPHPAGNVGVQINHISPISKGETVWTVDLFLVAAIGKLFLNGVYDTSRVIAVAGPAVVNPSYVKCCAGVAMEQISDLFNFANGNIRIVSGDLLSGKAVGRDGFLGFYDNLVTALPEGDYHELFGWAKPFRLKKFSFSRSYYSWLMPRKKYNMDTNTNGGERAFVLSDVYGKVLPMDIYPVYLFKAILARDIEKMENLGIYEIIEEDVALCEFVCPSKIEIQSIVSQGIELMIKEMS
ncbi:MAG: Na(+)-translocating NADH-quinone reductase subunit A [Bacteroidales bacterium]|mgnify:CR=1 FL=1|nr:Na(+)-translocating NADH-quinone reductase subunit A [Bacteroidales bacterium]